MWIYLIELKTDEKGNKTALKISDEKDFQIHPTRPTDSCFVNHIF